MIDVGDHAASLQEAPVADYRVLSDEELNQVVGGSDGSGSGRGRSGRGVEIILVVFEPIYGLGHKLGAWLRGPCD